MIATWIWILIGVYLSLGVLFSVPFLFKRIQQSDPAARGASLGFRLIILPGVVLLWPLLARRWAAGVDHPPQERSPHRHDTPST